MDADTPTETTEAPAEEPVAEPEGDEAETPLPGIEPDISTEAAAESPEEEKTPGEEPTEAAAESPEEEPEAKEKTPDVEALAQRLVALEEALKAKDAEIQALKDDTAKANLLQAAGLDATKYSQFLHGAPEEWAGQVKALTDLRQPEKRRRDPAVDAPATSDSTDRETMVLRMFGLGD